MQLVFPQVFKAKDLITGNVVALKRIYLRQPSRGIFYDTRREVETLRAIEHKNVVKLLDFHKQVNCIVWCARISGVARF